MQAIFRFPFSGIQPMKHSGRSFIAVEPDARLQIVSIDSGLIDSYSIGWLENSLTMFAK